MTERWLFFTFLFPSFLIVRSRVWSLHSLCLHLLLFFITLLFFSLLCLCQHLTHSFVQTHMKTEAQSEVSILKFYKHSSPDQNFEKALSFLGEKSHLEMSKCACILYIKESTLLWNIHYCSKVWNNSCFFINYIFLKDSLLLTKAALIWSKNSKTVTLWIIIQI